MTIGTRGKVVQEPVFEVNVSVVQPRRLPDGRLQTRFLRVPQAGRGTV